MIKNRASSGKVTEKDILKKFKSGARIESNREMKVLEKWATAGLVRLGVDLEQMQAEAKLTKRGRWFLSIM